MPAPLPAQRRYGARFASDAADIAAAQALRAQSFGGLARDSDAFDPLCRHILVEDRRSNALVCCCRILPLTGGHEIAQSYSAQFYDLNALQGFGGAMLELGRFCTLPGARDPDILRSAWGLLTTYVDAHDVRMLFGCSSFAGTDPERYRDTFAWLGARHLAPPAWRPGVKAAEVHRFAPCAPEDTHRAMRALPPLLRTYLAMGGQVSDHAVVDHAMNTLHVFTGLDIAAIPEPRKRLLRAVAAPDISAA